MKLGIVTYNIAAEWDLDTIIEVCQEVGLAGVELRTTHAHGVELDLSPAQRRAVADRFADTGVTLVGLGSTYEYHATDPDELRRNVEGTKQTARLAADVGATGVKVRPNRLLEEVPVAKTLAQIGRALNEVAADAAEVGVEIRLEVHGHGTCLPTHIATIMAHAEHPNAKVCWNCNDADLDENGKLEPNFRLLAERIGLVHINRFYSGYPYAELFRLLKESGYEGFCLAEIPGVADVASAKELLRYYRYCFELLGGA